MISKPDKLEFTASVLADGRISVPAKFREAMGFQAGTKLVVQFEKGQATLMTAQEQGRRVQEQVAQLQKAGVLQPSSHQAAERIRALRNEDEAVTRE